MLTPEQVARQTLELYETYYNDSLDLVEAEWAATEDIALSDFVTRQFTADPSSLEAAWLLPALAIGVGPWVPVTGIKTQQMINFYDLEMQVVYYFQDIDSHRLGVIIMRHMQATLDFLNKHPGLDLRGGDVSISEGPRLLPSRVMPRGNALVKGLLVQFNIRFEQYGF
jgi:hypothetical protein